MRLRREWRGQMGPPLAVRIVVFRRTGGRLSRVLQRETSMRSILAIW